MFAYCRSNPVVRSDAAGTNPLDTLCDDGDARSGDELKVNYGRCPGGGGGNYTTLYRSVSLSEANSIANTQTFSITNTSMTCKQFGFSFQETALFSKWANQTTIVSVDIPTQLLNKFWTTTVDATIFKHGTVTVYSEFLPLLHDSMTNLQFYTIIK